MENKESPRFSAILSLMLKARVCAEVREMHCFTGAHGQEVPPGTFPEGCTLGRVNRDLGFTVYGIVGTEQQAIDRILVALGEI